MATNTNLEKIDGAIALLEATESTLDRVDMTSLSIDQDKDVVAVNAKLHTAKLVLQALLACLKEEEGREPWQNSGT